MGALCPCALSLSRGDPSLRGRLCCNFAHFQLSLFTCVPCADHDPLALPSDRRLSAGRLHRGQVRPRTQLDLRGLRHGMRSSQLGGGDNCRHSLCVREISDAAIVGSSKYNLHVATRNRSKLHRPLGRAPKTLDCRRLQQLGCSSKLDKIEAGGTSTAPLEHCALVHQQQIRSRKGSHNWIRGYGLRD